MSKENSIDDIKAELKTKIKETLNRWESETDKSGDGFDIIRWARKGWLKIDEDKFKGDL